MFDHLINVVIFRPKTVEYSCLVGKDGATFDTDFGDYESDDSDCDGWSNLNKEVTINRGSSTHFDTLRMALWASLAMAALFGMWAVCKRGTASFKKITDAVSTEQDPLLQSF